MPVSNPSPDHIHVRDIYSSLQVHGLNFAGVKAFWYVDVEALGHIKYESVRYDTLSIQYLR